MDRYTDPSMNRLATWLGATGVLSDEYRRFVESTALVAIGESYHRGVAEGQARPRPVTSSKIIAAQEAEASYLRIVGRRSMAAVNDDDRVRLMLEAAEAVR